MPPWHALLQNALLILRTLVQGIRDVNLQDPTKAPLPLNSALKCFGGVLDFCHSCVLWSKVLKNVLERPSGIVLKILVSVADPRGMQTQTDALRPLHVRNSQRCHTNEGTRAQHRSHGKTTINCNTKHERRNGCTATREMCHCYPQLRHAFKISNVALCLFAPWLRLLRPGSALPLHSLQ